MQLSATPLPHLLHFYQRVSLWLSILSLRGFTIHGLESRVGMIDVGLVRIGNNMMNARMAMLVLVAALFAAAWNSDRNQQATDDPRAVAFRRYQRSLENQRALARVDQRSGVRPSDWKHSGSSARTSESVVRNPRASTHHIASAIDGASTVTLREVHSATGRLVQLPANITAGRYRVVDANGLVDSVIIPGVVVRATDNLFQQLDRGRRTYFIRIEERFEATASRTPEVGSALQ